MGLGNNLAHHGLNDTCRTSVGAFSLFDTCGVHHTDIAIKHTTDDPPDQGYPKVLRETDNEEGKYGSKATQQHDWLPAHSIRQRSPPHAGQRLTKSEGGDEDAGVEGGIVSTTDVETSDHKPSVGEDAGESNGFCNATYCCRQVSYRRSSEVDGDEAYRG